MARHPTQHFYYQYVTSAGPVKIVPTSGGRFEVIYNGDGLGSYHSAIAAVDDVSGGHTFSPANGVDFADLDIPEDIGEWEKRPFAQVHPLRGR